MAEGGESDRCLIGKSAKSKTKYGTTTNAVYTNETYLKHVLDKTDTLQGLALKYGVAVSFCSTSILGISSADDVFTLFSKQALTCHFENFKTLVPLNL